MKLTASDIDILDRADSLSGACASLGRSENQTRRLAQKALKDGRLSHYAAGVWRGWLGRNGEVEVKPAPPDRLSTSTSSFLPDEPPLPAAETPPAPAEQVFAVRPAAEPPALAVLAAGDILRRLRRIPSDATYADIVQTYRDGRTMKDSHAALRRFVANHAAELPIHVVKLVAPKALKEPTGPSYFIETANRLARVEGEVEQLKGIVQVMGMQIDVLVEEEEAIAVVEEEDEEFFPPAPPFDLGAVLWPVVTAWSLTRTGVRRTIAVARRVPVAAGRFADILRGKEF